MPLFLSPGDNLGNANNRSNNSMGVNILQLILTEVEEINKRGGNTPPQGNTNPTVTDEVVKNLKDNQKSIVSEIKRVGKSLTSFKNDFRSANVISNRTNAQIARNANSVRQMTGNNSTLLNNLSERSSEGFQSVRQTIQDENNMSRTENRTGFNAVVNSNRTLLKTLSSGFRLLGKGIGKIFSEFKNKGFLGGLTSLLFQGVKGLLSLLGKGLWMVFRPLLGLIGKGLGKLFSPLWTSMKSVGTSLLSSLKNGFFNVMKGIGGMLSKIGSSIMSTLSGFGKTLLSGLSSAMSRLGGLLTAGFSKVKDFFSDSGGGDEVDMSDIDNDPNLSEEEKKKKKEEREKEKKKKKKKKGGLFNKAKNLFKGGSGLMRTAAVVSGGAVATVAATNMLSNSNVPDTTTPESRVATPEAPSVNNPAAREGVEQATKTGLLKTATKFGSKALAFAGGPLGAAIMAGFDIALGAADDKKIRESLGLGEDEKIKGSDRMNAGIASATGGLVDAVSGMFGFETDVAGWMTRTGKVIDDTIAKVPILGDFIGTMKNISGEVVNFVGGMVSNIGKGIWSAVTLDWDGVKDAFSGVVKTIGGLFSGVFTSLYDGVTGFIGKITGIFADIGKWIWGKLEKIYDFVSNVVSGVWNYIWGIEEEEREMIKGGIGSDTTKSLKDSINEQIKKNKELKEASGETTKATTESINKDTETLTAATAAITEGNKTITEGEPKAATGGEEKIGSAWDRFTKSWDDKEKKSRKGLMDWDDFNTTPHWMKDQVLPKGEHTIPTDEVAPEPWEIKSGEKSKRYFLRDNVNLEDYRKTEKQVVTAHSIPPPDAENYKYNYVPETQTNQVTKITSDKGIKVIAQPTGGETTIATASPIPVFNENTQTVTAKPVPITEFSESAHSPVIGMSTPLITSEKNEPLAIVDQPLSSSPPKMLAEQTGVKKVSIPLKDAIEPTASGGLESILTLLQSNLKTLGDAILKLSEEQKDSKKNTPVGIQNQASQPIMEENFGLTLLNTGMML